MFAYRFGTILGLVWTTSLLRPNLPSSHLFECLHPGFSGYEQCKDTADVQKTFYMLVCTQAMDEILKPKNNL